MRRSVLALGLALSLAACGRDRIPDAKDAPTVSTPAALEDGALVNLVGRIREGLVIDVGGQIVPFSSRADSVAITPDLHGRLVTMGGRLETRDGVLHLDWDGVLHEYPTKLSKGADVATVRSGDVVTVEGTLRLAHPVDQFTIPAVVLPGDEPAALQLREVPDAWTSLDGQTVRMEGRYQINWSINPGGHFLLGMDGDVPALTTDP